MIQEDAVVRVVDGVLEDVRLGLELNIPKMNQRRFSGLKFLGELYSYQLVESNVVFRTLYLMLQFGATVDGELVGACIPYSRNFSLDKNFTQSSYLICVVLNFEHHTSFPLASV